MAAVIAVVSVWVGIFISFILNLPTGATIVLLNFVFFIVLYGIKKMSVLSSPGQR